jgi:tetratricopeptide (TPR) repeat protein
MSTVAYGLEPPRLETLEQLTRIQIPVTSGSGFHLLNGKAGEVTLVVERVGSGITESLAKLKDERVKDVTVKTVGLDSAEVTVHFLDPKTESFAYNQGNNLVLDLWKSKADTLASDAKKTVPGKAKREHVKSERKIASAQSKAPIVSKVAPLKIGQDLFHRFVLPMPDLEIAAKDGGIDLPPRFKLVEGWKFSDGNKDTDDGKAFEFAKKLFAAKKFGLCLKTIEILLRDHPKTEYLGEVEFLRALAYRRLGEETKTDTLVDRSEKMLQELAAKRNEAGESLPFARSIVLHFASDQLNQKNWLAALPHLEYVISVTKPTDPEYPYVQMLLAEAYGNVDEPRRAERIYRFLVERFPKHLLAKEAYYRIADLLAVEKNYSRVIDEGEGALQTYPEYEKARAEVLFNIGEASFWLGNLSKAEKNLKRFTEIASAQTNASLAWVRLGEIEEVKNGDLNAAREDYLRAKNGYPFSKGDLVATVRMSRIDLPTEKDPKFVVRTLEQLLADKTLDFDLKRMAELTLADYLLLIGETERAIAIANSGMAQTDGLVFELFRKSYEKGLFARLQEMVRDKKFGDALGLYDREKKWLEDYGPETYRVVSEAYSGLGLFASANSLMEKFASEMAKGSRKPSSLDSTEKILQEKAANSFAQGAYQEALEEIGSRKDVRASYMKTVSLFRLGKKQDAYEAADRTLPLVKAAKAEFSEDEIEILGEILLDRDSSDRDFPRMERNSKELNSMCVKENERFTFAAADAVWYQKHNKEAEAAYKGALTKFPKSVRSDRARYNLGMCLVAEGKRDEAVKLLTELKNSGQSVWSDSAKEELELIDWEQKYSSVLRTLPPSGLGIAN